MFFDNNNIQFFPPDNLFNLENSRNLTCFSMLYKILHDGDHPLHCKLPLFLKPIHITRYIVHIWELMDPGVGCGKL